MVEEKTRKYVVGEKNKSAPVLRISHDRGVKPKATAKPKPKTTTQTDQVYKHEGHALFISRDKKPRISSNFGTPTKATTQPIKPINQQPKTHIGAANIVRQQISQIPDHHNKTMIEKEKDLTLKEKTERQFDEAISRNAAPKTTRNRDEIATDFTAANAAKKHAEAEARKHYHSAWRQYYQGYYEKYYANELKKHQEKILRNEARILLEQKKLAEKASNKPEFSRNYLGAAAGKATASLRDNGTIEGFENARASDLNRLRYDITSRAKQNVAKVRKSRHFWPAIVAVFVVLMIGFIQFNGVIFAQIGNFVSPGSTTGQNIIIGTGSNQPVGEESQIIIPKINVRAPVQYNIADLSEEGSQKALENGPIHYPIEGATAFPGMLGNTVILGHSSADWFEAGDYKFIFVQLNRLAEGDLFYLDHKGIRYTYRISRTQIIAPDQLGALNIGQDKPYATIITCDPPGTAINRLLVIGEQISPDPTGVTSTQTYTASGANSATNITGNPPTLFEKIFGGK